MQNATKSELVKVWLVNFGWFAIQEFGTLAEALAWTKRHGYESTFSQGGKRLGSWTYFGGFKS
jgi:hypothetical protein